MLPWHRSLAKESPINDRRHLTPLGNVKVIGGVFSEAQKKEMVQKMTDTMVSIEGENIRQVTWVVIDEVQSGNWEIGVNAPTTKDVKALAASKS